MPALLNLGGYNIVALNTALGIAKGFGGNINIKILVYGTAVQLKSKQTVGNVMSGASGESKRAKMDIFPNIKNWFRGELRRRKSKERRLRSPVALL